MRVLYAGIAYWACTTAHTSSPPTADIRQHLAYGLDLRERKLGQQHSHSGTTNLHQGAAAAHIWARPGLSTLYATNLRQGAAAAHIWATEKATPGLSSMSSMDWA